MVADSNLLKADKHFGNMLNSQLFCIINYHTNYQCFKNITIKMKSYITGIACTLFCKLVQLVKHDVVMIIIMIN